VVGGQRRAPAALSPRKTRYPSYRRLGGSQGWSGRVWKFSPLRGFDPQDRPSRSESLYWLSYYGLQQLTVLQVCDELRINVKEFAHVISVRLSLRFYPYLYFTPSSVTGCPLETLPSNRCPAPDNFTRRVVTFRRLEVNYYHQNHPLQTDSCSHLSIQTVSLFLDMRNSLLCLSFLLERPVGHREVLTDG
jgi:hypothetical protein